MSLVGVGRSNQVDARGAVAEAWESACAGLTGAPSAVLVFSTVGYVVSEVLARLSTHAPAVSIVGCSAEGLISQGAADEVDHALGLMVFGPELRGDGFLVPGYGAHPGAAGAELARRVSAKAGDDAALLLVFPDGLSGDCDAFLAALSAGLPPGLPVVGGAAGDALRMERTYQFCGREATTGAVSALLLRGRGRARVYVGHGCRPIGRTKLVTRVDDAGWVVELDGESAWEQFRSYLDGDPQDLSADGITHLSVGHLITDEAGHETMAVRTPLVLRKSDGALFFPGGGIGVGARLRMLRRDPEQITEDALAVARRMLADAAGRKPDFVLQFDCSGRGKLLFGACAADALVTPVQQLVGTDVPWLGFHTYGEIGTAAGAPRYHNYTVVLVPFYVEGSA